MPDPPTGSMNWVNGAAKIRKLAIPVSAVVGITAISGAFVAGNDAVSHYPSLSICVVFSILKSKNIPFVLYV
jgi:cytochrome c oxidase assembly protein subunit 15